MLSKKPNKSNGKYEVTFHIPPEQLPDNLAVTDICVVASFNNWSIAETPMIKKKSGAFEVKLALEPGRHEFRYLLNGERWYNDWNADAYIANRFQTADNCVLNLEPFDKKPAPKEPRKQSKDKKDDLRTIKGIGPKIAVLLKAQGVSTFAELAALSVAELRKILDGKVRIFSPGHWPEQAKLAAKGKWDELKALQDSL